ncbi:hypothetical protein [Sphingomonas sp. SFZ2018-12]|uniref:hypothetical protein n=1 Tax=Sphingomonas sp. SFZ2018-12 TaxID=2683197 RepID=UPI001F0D60AF|nr:hypothetical protein [Sphingomonas sp. SFZ2018-12]
MQAVRNSDVVQAARLARRAAELDALMAYLDAKIAWVERGGQGEAPRLLPPQQQRP